MKSIFKITILAASIIYSQSGFANEPWSPDRQWLLGDWGSERQQLELQGYKFNFSFLSQAANNISGGYNDNSIIDAASQLTLGAAFDLSKIANLDNTTASLVITKRDNNALTAERIKDPRSSQLGNVQDISGRGKIWRLSQAWIKQGFQDNKLQLKAGRMGMSEDFNSSQCEFQNVLLCGGQLAKSIGSIVYNSPVGVWAANAKYQFAPSWNIGVGIYEVNPDDIRTDTGRYGFNLSLKDETGVTIPVELAWKPTLDGLSGEYKVGVLYSTAKANDVQTSTVHDSKHSFWVNTQQQLTQLDSDPKRGLYASFNGVLNDRATTAVESTQQLAFWYKGPFDRRPNDSIGFAIGNYLVNKRLTDKQIATDQKRGFTTYIPVDKKYIPIQRDELNIELNYTYNWSPAIMIRPNIQYVHQPAGVKEVNDCWVAGLTLRTNF